MPAVPFLIEHLCPSLTSFVHSSFSSLISYFCGMCVATYHISVVIRNEGEQLNYVGKHKNVSLRQYVHVSVNHHFLSFPMLELPTFSFLFVGISSNLLTSELIGLMEQSLLVFWASLVENKPCRTELGTSSC